MTDRRVLVDNDSRTLSRIVDGLHDVAAALGDRPFAIVGGIAVLTHVQGHRVTHDIDSAARGPGDEIRQGLLAVAEPNPSGDSDLLLPNGVPLDLLVAGLGPPAISLGRGLAARRIEATGHAIRFAIETARIVELVCEPANSRGPATVPVADVGALMAMKTLALTDPSRGEKAASDHLDLWLLLTNDLDRASDALEGLSAAPAPARRWAAEVLVRLFRDHRERLLRSVADGVGAPRSVADVDDIWRAVIEPQVNQLRK